MTLLFDCSGARARRVIDPSGALIAEHAHDWPMISLYVLGGYTNVTECGEQTIGGPSMVFYSRGAAHRNAAGEMGFEQVEIEFDPSWLGACALPPEAVLGRHERPASFGTWIPDVAKRLRTDPAHSVGELAREVGRSPAWIGPAYRRVAGEGLQETAARFRVERAARLLRESDAALTAVAAEAGFCDQSHMNRTFRRVLGRLPTAVRHDRRAFRDG